MLLHTAFLDGLPEIFSLIGLEQSITSETQVAIKINLAKPPVAQIPRTDQTLLRFIIHYLNSLGTTPTIIESADGYLEQNLVGINLQDEIISNRLNFIDLDQQPVEKYIANDGEIHYLPKCLKQFNLRLAILGISYLPNHIFSNNIKLFVGLVPRRYYQKGSAKVARPSIHKNLHRSVANIFHLVNQNMPFDYYINGGGIILHHKPEIRQLPYFYVSDNAIELDHHILNLLEIEKPEYFTLLQDKQVGGPVYY